MSLGILLSITALIFGSGHDASHALHGSFIDSTLDLGHHGVSSEEQEDISSTNVPLLNINALFAFLIGFGAAGLIAYGILKVAIISLIPALAIGSLFWYMYAKHCLGYSKDSLNFLPLLWTI